MAAKSEHLQDDAYEGAKVILRRAVELVPKESGHLAETGHVDRGRGGNNTVGIIFNGPYAAYIHEHLFFKHPHGGQAKYLEDAMLEKGSEAVNKAGEHFWRRLT
jgi:hypothetical protein